MEPPRWAMPCISAFATSKPSSIAASHTMSLKTTMPWPPTPVKMRSSFIVVVFSLLWLGVDILFRIRHSRCRVFGRFLFCCFGFV